MTAIVVKQNGLGPSNVEKRRLRQDIIYQKTIMKLSI